MGHCDLAWGAARAAEEMQTLRSNLKLSTEQAEDLTKFGHDEPSLATSGYYRTRRNARRPIGAGRHVSPGR
eukprot:6373763-Prymnesium_polylepis.1